MYVTCDLTSYVTCYHEWYIAYVLKEGTCSTQGSARVCKHLQAQKKCMQLMLCNMLCNMLFNTLCNMLCCLAI